MPPKKKTTVETASSPNRVMKPTKSSIARQVKVTVTPSKKKAASMSTLQASPSPRKRGRIPRKAVSETEVGAEAEVTKKVTKKASASEHLKRLATPKKVATPKTTTPAKGSAKAVRNQKKEIVDDTKIDTETSSEWKAIDTDTNTPLPPTSPRTPAGKGSSKKAANKTLSGKRGKKVASSSAGHTPMAKSRQTKPKTPTIIERKHATTPAKKRIRLGDVGSPTTSSDIAHHQEIGHASPVSSSAMVSITDIDDNININGGGQKRMWEDDDESEVTIELEEIENEPETDQNILSKVFGWISSFL